MTRLCSNLEKDGIREYKLLVRDSEGYDNGFYKTVVSSTIRDSEKQVELHEFLR
jgi:hypothetical protein